jgi:shikimate dehydrogenase
MYQLGVIGNPINHSLSPVVFSYFASQFNISLNYSKILAKDTLEFKQIVTDFFNSGGIALNVTSPFKQEAYAIATQKTIRSQFCKASNLLTQHTGQILADTTDGIGLINDLIHNNNFDIANKNILILGSGFVLDSILLDFIHFNPKRVDILARNQARVTYLTDKFAIGVYAANLNYDLILNTSPNTPDNILLNQIKSNNIGQLCYDMGYTDHLTLFLSLMQQLSSATTLRNGLGMLIEQAKVAFVKLFNKIPDSQSVFAQILQGK